MSSSLIDLSRFSTIPFSLLTLISHESNPTLRDLSFPSFFFSVSGDSLMSRIYSSLSGGELFEKITSEGYSMSEAEVINYMRQICEGVKHMHERNIIHLGNYKYSYMCGKIRLSLIFQNTLMNF